MSESNIAKTIDEVGIFLNLSRRQVQTHLARGMPGRPGSYPLTEIVAWMRDNVWQRRQNSSASSQPIAVADDDSDDDLAIARSRRTKSAARLSALVDQPAEVIRQWMKEPGFPKSPDGSISEFAFCLWAARNGKQPGPNRLRIKVDD